MPQSKSFSNIRFKDFQRLATDESLSCYERIGFPDHYRKGFEEKIFEDILQKITNLMTQTKHVIDIGPGCSELPKMLITLCRQ